MTALAVAFITLACAFGAALLGGLIRDRLPAAHLSKESQDVVRLGMGLVATMTALLLGLVTAAARGTFDAQDTAVKNRRSTSSPWIGIFASTVPRRRRRAMRFGPC